MTANFKPEQNSYKDLGQFRFWCQKVLPLTYDDSLSYYELLCKVVNILNETINNVSLTGEDMTKLYSAYEELQTFVNNYFTNLDVQEEINNKLDEMVTTGEFSTLLSRLTTYVTPEMYGAIGDGVTDDTVAIQNTFNVGGLILFMKNKTYLVSNTLTVGSNTEIDFNFSSVVKRVNPTAPIIQNSARTNGVTNENIVVRNVHLIGSGDTSVSDQGAGLLFWKVNNLTVENVITTNTNGDGILLRQTENTVCNNIIVNNYGRNAISPCSGSIILNNFVVKGSAIKGANPGIDIDCESENGELLDIIFNNVKAKNVYLVDFYTTADKTDFCIKAKFTNCVFDCAYNTLHIQSTNNLRANIIIDKSNKFITDNGSCITIQNVNGVTIDSCEMQKTGTKAYGIQMTNANNTTIKNIDLSAFSVNSAYGVISHNTPMSNCVFENYKGSVYGSVVKDTKFIDCDITAIDVLNASESCNNLFGVGTTVKYNNLPYDKQYYGAKDNNHILANRYATSVKQFADGDTKEIKIRIKSLTTAQCFSVISAYSHAGLTSNSGFEMVCCNIMHSTRLFSYASLLSHGDKGFTYTYDFDNNVLVVRADNNFIGNMSVTILG